uniref:Uncharacterized protein n=1 Tax=Apteryx owenii TaxID=8824 RepID=A0A8B9SBF4_APTOW
GEGGGYLESSIRTCALAAFSVVGYPHTDLTGVPLTLLSPLSPYLNLGQYRTQMSLSCPQEPTKLRADLNWLFSTMEVVVQLGQHLVHWTVCG